MNTVNAAGYLFGALLLPRVLARFDARAVLLAGQAASPALLLVAHGAVLGRRGAVRAALLLRASRAPRPSSPAGCSRRGWHGDPHGRAELRGAGLVLGIYYGGTGVGIVAVAPCSCRRLPRCAAAACLAMGVARAGGACWRWPPASPRAARGAATSTQAGAAAAAHVPSLGAVRLRALAAYFMFGLGYIGYMTFVVTLLREQQAGAVRASSRSTACSALPVIASSWLWAGLLQRLAAASRSRC